MALRIEDAQAMIDTCASEGVKFGYGASYRHLPTCLKARELIASGESGDVTLMLETVISGHVLGSPNVGGMGVTFGDDPRLDELLLATRRTVDPEQRQDVLDEVQKYLIEEALMVPLYAAKIYVGLNTRLKGVLLGPDLYSDIWLTNAYVEG
jgi:ABC-type transport system substrate-binding protein